MAREKFQKNKTYYLESEEWKLKYIGRGEESAYEFRVTEHNDKENNWYEYSTRDGSEILADRSKWLLSLKETKPL